MEPRFLDLAEVLEIHVDQIERYGGAAGIRDLPLLLSALSMPEAGIHGEYVHGTLFEIAAAYLFHLTKNHPFVDGNKRTALASALVFLGLNGIGVAARSADMVALVEGVVVGKYAKGDVARWLRAHGRT